MANDEIFLEKCKQEIEAILRWGPGENWQNADFDNLSELIFQKTGVSLSCSTLKRVWGKVNYQNTPSLATLNALARFAGHEQWRSFVDIASEAKKPDQSLPLQNAKPVRSSYLFLSVSLVLVIGIIISIFWSAKKKKGILLFKDLVFHTESVAAGVPNTVVFNYDVSASNADSVFIQQDWDPKKRAKVDKYLHAFTTTYYEPGYFKAKLMLNDSVVKTQDVFIESRGWLGVFRKNPIPVYFRSEEINKEGVVGISEADLLSKGISIQHELYPLIFYNVSRDHAMPSDSFRLSVDIRNTFNKNDGICQFSDIGLMGTDGMFLIPLGIKGCSGELNLILGSEMVSGKTNDLSGLGADFSRWVNVRTVVQEREIRIFVDGKIAYSHPVNVGIGKIVGVFIAFLGTGEFKEFELMGADKGMVASGHTDR